MALHRLRRQLGAALRRSIDRIDRRFGPGSTTLELANNYREVWPYRRELLPAKAPYQQVDFEFITKKGYGENVLQRDPQALNTIDVAKFGAGPKEP